MEWIKNNKKLVISLGIIIVIIAGVLDIAYEGLIYQMLPESIQNWF